MKKFECPSTQGGWVKYDRNPIIGDPIIGTCFDVYVMQIQGEGYRMYFSWRPKKSLAVTTSMDGIHWEEPQIILEPRLETGWEDDLNRNCVVKKDGMYHMWYTGQAHGNSWIGYAISEDGYAWNRIGSEPVLIPEQPWEGMSVMNPCVLWNEQQGVFQMWYSGGETYEPNCIGYAISSDGVKWSKHRANPIYTANPNDVFEQDRIGGCQVLQYENKYLMFYIGYEDIDTARICAAWSPDGITRWNRFTQNPLISPDKDSWDGDACYKPSVIWNEEENCWMLWYNGRRGAPEYIGLAIHQGKDLGI